MTDNQTKVTPKRDSPRHVRLHTDLPRFSHPPVVETILGIQFSPLANYSTALAGHFWKSALGREWTSATEAPRLEDQVERFGERRDQWGVPGIQLRTAPTPERLQIIRDDGERMIQIQNSRFVCNWRRVRNEYPTFRVLLPEYLDLFRKFIEYVTKEGLGDLKPNQWEVTYVNHIPKGVLWERPDDWSSIFPGLLIPKATSLKQDFESLTGSWRLGFEDKARLHITMQHALLRDKREEVLSLQLTARGPVNSIDDTQISEALELGHEQIVLTFEGMTSAKAHRIWGKK